MKLFKNPIAIEVKGAGVDKPAGVRYITLRFPRLQKIYGDRTFKETASFDELQELARTSQEASVEDDSEGERYWAIQLKERDPEFDQSVAEPIRGANKLSEYSRCNARQG